MQLSNFIWFNHQIWKVTSHTNGQTKFAVMVRPSRLTVNRTWSQSIDVSILNISSVSWHEDTNAYRRFMTIRGFRQYEVQIINYRDANMDSIYHKSNPTSFDPLIWVPKCLIGIGAQWSKPRQTARAFVREGDGNSTLHYSCMKAASITLRAWLS